MPLRMPSGFSRVAGSNGVPAPYGEWEKRLPNLCGFLCDCLWEDGSSKATGKLSLWTGDGLWKASLSLPEPAVVAFLAAEDPSALLQRIEKAIKEDSLEWRKSIPFEKRKSKRT